MIKVYKYGGITAYLNDENGHITYFNKELKDYKILDQIDGYNDILQSNRCFNNYSVFSIGFNISNNCNLNCNYCFHNRHNDESIDEKFVRRSINEFLITHSQCKKLFVDLSGHGEPLLSLHTILNIAKFCKEESQKFNMDIIPNLITNGILLTKQNANLLQNNGVLFGVSIDGEKSTHDAFRKFKDGSPTYDIIIRHLSEIEDKRFIGASMTLQSGYKYDILKCYCSMIDLVPTIAIRFERNLTKEIIENDYSDFIIEGYKNTKEYIQNRILNNDYKLIYGILNGDDLFGTIILRVLSGSVTNTSCEGLIARFTATRHGIFPCSPASDLDVFGNNSYDVETNDFFKYSIFNNYCLKCFARNYCGGECPIVFKEIGHPDLYTCKIKKSILNFAIEFSCFLMENPKHLKSIKAFINEKIKRYNIKS